MDHREAQLHQEIVHTRRAIDDKLAQLEHWGQQTLHGVTSRASDVIDQDLVTNVQWVQEARDRSVAVVVRCPWLIVAGGALLGYCLSRLGKAQRPRTMPGVVRRYAATAGYASVGTP
jgi:hypothetical protein